jgi:hypothetical protein
MVDTPALVGEESVDSAVTVPRVRAGEPPYVLDQLDFVAGHVSASIGPARRVGKPHAHSWSVSPWRARRPFACSPDSKISLRDVLEDLVVERLFRLQLL